MGLEPVWPETLSNLFQDLYRKGLGRTLQRDSGRVGGPAHSGAVPSSRRIGGSRAAEATQTGQIADPSVQVSSPRPRADVATLRRADGQARRRVASRPPDH